MLHHPRQAGGITAGLAAEGRAKKHGVVGEKGLLDWVPGEKAAGGNS